LASTPPRVTPHALFLCSCATLLFAADNWVGYLVGAITVINAFGQLYLMWVHPIFASGELKRTSDPYAVYTGSKEEMQRYLAAHPERAAQLGSAATGVALEAGKLAVSTAPHAAPQGQLRGGVPKGGASSNPFG
jgi:hypothetical protein